jgi:chemotaxis family two-component system response regulator Rcp1
MRPDFHILLVEDSQADVKIIERALREGSVDHRLTVIRDGRQALDYLLRLQDPGSLNELVPDLILLDLNLPGIDGCQVLSRIKNDPYLRAIPVVILTTSRREEDILQTYQAGANTYIQKPAEYPRYRDLVATLRLYGRDTARGPPRVRPPYLKLVRGGGGLTTRHPPPGVLVLTTTCPSGAVGFVMNRGSLCRRGGVATATTR